MSDNNESSDNMWGEALNEQALADAKLAQPAGGQSSLDMVEDIPVELSVEIGRARLPIGQVLRLAQGSIVELDVLAGEPLNVYVNGILIAQGEVVVVNDKFGIRLTDVITPSERAKRMMRG